MATKDVFSKDDYFKKAGDMCYGEDEEQFFVTDNVRELIKYKGLKKL